jgi:hypothetical protein
MIYSAPTITKEQYERLAKLDEDKKFDYTLDGDRLSAFLKEHVGEGNINNVNSDVNFYKLFERVA